MNEIEKMRGCAGNGRHSIEDLDLEIYLQGPLETMTSVNQIKMTKIQKMRGAGKYQGVRKRDILEQGGYEIEDPALGIHMQRPQKNSISQN